MIKYETMVMEPTRSRLGTWLTARLITLAHVYVTWLFIWAGLRFFFQDRWAWLFLISAFGIHLFLPLPLLLLAAFVVRRRTVWVGFTLALVLWLALFGGLFLPKPAKALAGDTTLTVMTYNLLASNGNIEAVTAALRDSGADVISLGELNLEMGAVIKEELGDIFPYQVLDPQPDVFGDGIISRYPLSPTGEALPGDRWMGDPQILEMDLNGTPVILLNFHALPMGTTGGISGLIWSVNKREEQAQTVIDYVTSKDMPVVVLGDLNAGDQHKAYKILTAELTDAWREGGWGLGHTYSHVSPYKKLQAPVILGVTVVPWAIRIDYVFHTDEWKTDSAWIGSWDGGSDHRPVMARLILVDEAPEE